MIDAVEIKIVGTDDEYAKAMAVRRKVFVQEQNIPEEKEFDGNDHSATHILALHNGEPIGEMRIRYFNGFVKFERMCVLKEYRKTDVSERIMQTGMVFAARKGYEKVYGICKKELLNRWKQDGFLPIPGAPFVRQNGMTLIPVYSQLPKVQNVLTMQTPTEILNAREGQWEDTNQADKYADMRRNMQNRLQEVRQLKTPQPAENSGFQISEQKNKPNSIER